MESFFVTLYPLVALLALSGYVPQFIALYRAKSAKDGIALQSWITWVVNNTISLGYGIFHLHDPMFIATVACSITAQIVVIAMLVYNRHFRFRTGGICVHSLRTRGAI